MLKVLKQRRRSISVGIAGGIWVILFAFTYWNPAISNDLGLIIPIKIVGAKSEVDRSQENQNKSGMMINLGLHYYKLQYVDHSSLIIPTDVVSPLQVEKENSDLFYYLLGIIILIISAFIFKQRYKQFLEEKRKKR